LFRIPPEVEELIPAEVGGVALDLRIEEPERALDLFLSLPRVAATPSPYLLSSVLDMKDSVDAGDFEDLPHLSRGRAERESSRIDPAVLVCP
jgi:hypothetical protein